MSKIKVGIVGGTGYTAGELLRILIHHPHTEITFVYSTSQAGQAVSAIHTDLLGDTNLTFTRQIQAVDVVFLCLGHGISRTFLQENPFPENTKVIDLGNDFRLENTFDDKGFARKFVYGLPEVNRSAIQKAHNIANPGCFATAIELALLPLVKTFGLKESVHANAITGSTGAGRSLSETTHFSWRNDNLSVYKPFKHQHLNEIAKLLSASSTQTEADYLSNIHLIPLRGNFSRGILATLYTKLPANFEEVLNLYQTFYKDEPYTHVTTQSISLKDVVNTNKCLLQIETHEGFLFITSVIDNLLKGASGQAVQNMNLLFGLEETCGLGLKSLGY